MTLKIYKATDDLARLRDAALERARALQTSLPEAVRVFESAGQKKDLRETALEKTNQGWDGALPFADEPILLRKPAPPVPQNITLVAVDGSQIYPDRHAAVLYYALNIGSFILRTESGQTAADSFPSIASDDADLYVGENTITNVLVNVRRSVQEMSGLRMLALREQQDRPGRPILALLDGGIALRVDEAAGPAAERDRLKKEYSAAVQDLTRAEIPFAGYISRPGGSPVLELALLAAGTSAARPFPGVSDRMLFERLLAPGERSALFEFGTFWNKRYQEEAGGREQSVHFFYMNAGRRAPVIARVEVPGWLAAQPELVDRIHGMLIEQCSVTLSDPYPYALIRADEQAFVSAAEKSYLEREMARAFSREGIFPHGSEKLRHKGRARSR
jgi:hypothetical protein